MGQLDFERRWQPIFGTETWWSGTREAYEVALDQEDERERSRPIEELVYRLAKASAKDTTQTCPKCGRVVDEVRCLGKYSHCELCVADEEAEHLAYVQWNKDERLRREAAYAAMTPEERLEADRGVTLNLMGLVRRDVQ